MYLSSKLKKLTKLKKNKSKSNIKINQMKQSTSWQPVCGMT